MPTSTLLPAEIACCSFVSSWPECTMTWTPGCSFSKSLTTPWMTVASRSVKKCHSETVPLSLVGAVLSIAVLPPALQPLSAIVAAVASAAAPIRWRRKRAGRVGELIFIDVRSSLGCCVGMLGNERIHVAVESCTDLAEQEFACSFEHRMLVDTGRDDGWLPARVIAHVGFDEVGECRSAGRTGWSAEHHDIRVEHGEHGKHAERDPWRELFERGAVVTDALQQAREVVADSRRDGGRWRRRRRHR